VNFRPEEYLTIILAAQAHKLERLTLLLVW